MTCAGDDDGLRRRVSSCEADLYTWASIVPWPETGFVELIEGLENFREVRSGEPLGVVDGQPLLATGDGKILFPKYLTRQQQSQQTSRPTEVLRIMRPLRIEELPTS